MKREEEREAMEWARVEGLLQRLQEFLIAPENYQWWTIVCTAEELNRSNRLVEGSSDAYMKYRTWLLATTPPCTEEGVEEQLLRADSTQERKDCLLVLDALRTRDEHTRYPE